jgi:Ubiquitin elongating factor core
MVTDMLDLLVIVSRMAPASFGNLPRADLEEFMMFIVVFLSAPEYVHNPYVRSRMAEVSRLILAALPALPNCSTSSNSSLNLLLTCPCL